MITVRSARLGALTTAAALGVALVAVPAPSSASDELEVADATVEGPIATTDPDDGGDPAAAEVGGTYPWFSTWVDLEAAGFVEEEFYLSGAANAFDPATGALLEEDVPYRTRIIVRRPAKDAHFNGTILAEWQNVTAGYDLDALWGYEDVLRDGYAWVGISAQRVGVNHLAGWSTARYGDLDVTAGGTYTNDQLSYDIFAQAGKALAAPVGVDPMGGLDVDAVLAIGASQSAGRMVGYYDGVLQHAEEVFDGYGFVVGSAPQSRDHGPIFQILSETDVIFGGGPASRPPDSDLFRRWEVAGTAHSGWSGQVYRAPLQERDNPGGATQYNCVFPPFSRAPLHHVLAAAYDHLAVWAQGGAAPPVAEPLAFDASGIVRDELGLAVGGIRLSQVEVPIALNDGTNSPGDFSSFFCVLFGEHQPFDDETLDDLYANHGRYVSAVTKADDANVAAGYIDRADAQQNQREAAQSGIGR
jgi:hypothetical protein